MEFQVSPRVYMQSQLQYNAIMCSATLIMNAVGIPKNFMIEILVAAVRQDVEKKHLMHHIGTQEVFPTLGCAVSTPTMY